MNRSVAIGRLLSSTYEVLEDGGVAARFIVPVAKDGKSVLKYRIRARW